MLKTMTAVLLECAPLMLLSYVWGKFIGWRRGYSEGFNNGRGLGRIERTIECQRDGHTRIFADGVEQSGHASKLS